MTDVAPRIQNGFTHVALGLLAVNLAIPAMMSLLLKALPLGVPFQPVFWACVVSLVILNLIVARRMTMARPFVFFLVPLNLLSTYMIGTLAFLPVAHIWAGLVFETLTTAQG